MAGATVFFVVGRGSVADVFVGGFVFSSPAGTAIAVVVGAEALLETSCERVFLVRELVDEVSCVAPEREIGVVIGIEGIVEVVRAAGQALTICLLVVVVVVFVVAVGIPALSPARGGGEGVQRDGGLVVVCAATANRALSVERNFRR